MFIFYYWDYVKNFNKKITFKVSSWTLKVLKINLMKFLEPVALKAAIKIK